MTAASVDTAALRTAAEAATPGPWPEAYVQWAVRHIARNCDYGDDASDEEMAGGSSFCWDRYKDGPFVAAANPAVVLALLDRLDAAEAEVANRTNVVAMLQGEFKRDAGRA